MINGIERDAKIQEYKISNFRPSSAASSRSFMVRSIAVSLLWAGLYTD